MYLVHADVHLGEAGNTLIRNVDFEIPYFKKQAEKLQQQIADHEHRHEEYLRNAEAASKDYKQVIQLLQYVIAIKKSKKLLVYVLLLSGSSRGLTSLSAQWLRPLALLSTVAHLSPLHYLVHRSLVLSKPVPSSDFMHQ